MLTPAQVAIRSTGIGASAARFVEIEPGSKSPPHVLSYSSAKLLVGKSALHAHQRKTGEVPNESSDEMDLGSIVHAMLLGAGKKVVVLDFPDYRTKAAREARDEVRAAGDVPVLARKEEVISAMARRLRARLAAMGFEFDGVSEIGVEWSEFADDGSEVSCRGALDHWRPKKAQILDLKIGESADPEVIKRTMIRFAYDVQATAYTRAVEQIHPELEGRTSFVLLFCELASGAVTPVTLAGSMAQLGRMRWRRAVNTWARCLSENEWPAYVTGPIAVEAPEWALAAETRIAHETDPLAAFVGGRRNDNDEGDDDGDAF